MTERVRRAERQASISLSYSEPAAVCRLVRGAAARSDVLYAAVNLLFGALARIIPEPDSANSYRMVMFARLS